jgi:RNA polymerase sigma factor (sigma-70 family)
MSATAHPTETAARVDAGGRAASGQSTARSPASLSALAGEINALLAAARPRLVHLARLQGLASDTADDVAQKACLAAWRSLDHLRMPERFDAWLDGITRNISRRHLRRQRLERAHLTVHFGSVSAADPADALAADDEADTLPAGTTAVASSATLDLDEELTHDELATLLDRALDHLSPGARTAVECCYLAEESPCGAAHRLGLTLNALETRLSRARQELRRILRRPLREEAAAFDLALDEESVYAWRQTRLWCHLCATRRLVGRIEETPAGTRFHLHCPDCWRRYGVAELDYEPHPLLHGLRSFHPAFKRVIQQVAPRALDGLRALTSCPACNGPAQSRLVPGTEVAHLAPAKSHLPAFTYLAFDCRTCGQGFASPCAIAGVADPLVRAFMLSRTRWRIERTEVSTFQCSPALRSRLVDLETGAQLTFFAHPETLKVLATFKFFTA